jgi:hypothetical protein
MLTGIIPFVYFDYTPRSGGSTFLRVERLVANDAGFEKWIHGKKYDSLIFQKAYWPTMMQLFKGPKILDLCDPDWLKYRLDIKEVGEMVHAITCSSKGLTQLVKTYFPDKTVDFFGKYPKRVFIYLKINIYYSIFRRSLVEHIPDRLDASLFPPPRSLHHGTAKKLVWFGYIHNAHETLAQLVPVIRENHLHLTIIADQPYTNEDAVAELHPDFLVYNQQTVYEQLKQFDMALNPQSDKAYYRYKSNNKSLISWKLGLPVAVTGDDIVKFLDPAERNREADKMRQIVNDEYLIGKSAMQYRKIIEQIKSTFF